MSHNTVKSGLLFRASFGLIALAVLCWSLPAWAAPTPVNVNLYNLGLATEGEGVVCFSNANSESTPIMTMAMSYATTNVKVYIGGITLDPYQRSLMVATLGTNGSVVGLPSFYPTNLTPEDPAGYGNVINCLALNAAKSRLYMAGANGTGTNSHFGLRVFTLDSTGNPSGAVREYNDDTTIYGRGLLSVALHPTQPVLYMGANLFSGGYGIDTYALNSNGDPTGTPTYTGFSAPVAGGSLAVSPNGKTLYISSVTDLLWVVSLNTNGSIQASSAVEYTVSNPQVGTLTAGSAFPYLAAGNNALYMVRPNPGGGLPNLGVWQLNSNGFPIGSAAARTDIHPPAYGLYLPVTIGLDNANSRLWVANPTTFIDDTGATQIDGMTPTSYSIGSTGLLSAGTAATSLPLTYGGAVTVPGTSGGVPFFFNFPLLYPGVLSTPDTPADRVRGYQARITVLSASGPTATFPMAMTDEQTLNLTSTTNSAGVYLGVPSTWANLDTCCEHHYTPISLQVAGPVGLTNLTVQLDLANSAGTILKSVTETGLGNEVWFVLPGYAESTAALTTNGGVAGLQTITQYSHGYLDAANVNPVASANHPKKFFIDCYEFLGGNFGLNGLTGGEGNQTFLNNMCQTLQALGMTGASTGYWGQINTNTVDSTLTSFGVVNRNHIQASAEEDIFESLDNSLPGGVLTAPILTAWLTNGLFYEQFLSAMTTSEMCWTALGDEFGWEYGPAADPNFLGELQDTTDYPNGVPAFQNYLASQPGLTPSMFGATAWNQVLPVGQSVGWPPSGGTPSTTNRVTYYWTMRYFVDAATSNMGYFNHTDLVGIGTNHPFIAITNNFNHFSSWYATEGLGDNGIGSSDWFLAGRTNAYSQWTEEWGGDNEAELYSWYAAGMRSAAMLGGTGTNLGCYNVGAAMGGFPAGAKYKMFSMIGNGAKFFSAFAWGPEFLGGANDWAGLTSTTNNPSGGSVYVELANANRLIGQAERVGTNDVLFNAVPEHGRVAVLVPDPSFLWNTTDYAVGDTYYTQEMQGIHYALSHGYNMAVDFVAPPDVNAGILTSNDYYALYVVGPNVHAATQTAIANWIGSFGAHSRQLILAPGAGTGDEYNNVTTNFDALAGLVSGSRTGDYAIPTTDVYTATIQDTNAEYYFNGQTLSILGDYQVLQPASGYGASFWADQVYTGGTGGTGGTGSTGGGGAACITKMTGSTTNNYVTAFGYYPGYQYLKSPLANVTLGNAAPTNMLPQGWNVMAREAAIMPIVRLVNQTTNPLVRSVELYNLPSPAGATTWLNNYLNTDPVEALRLNMYAGTNLSHSSVVLLNWGGSPVSNLKFHFNNGFNFTPTYTMASGTTTVTSPSNSGTQDKGVIGTLNDVDVMVVNP